MDAHLSCRGRCNFQSLAFASLHACVGSRRVPDARRQASRAESGQAARLRSSAADASTGPVGRVPVLPSGPPSSSARTADEFAKTTPRLVALGLIRFVTAFAVSADLMSDRRSRGGRAAHADGT